MAWLFSKALMTAFESSRSSPVPAGGSSVATSSDGALYVPSSVTLTPPPFSPRGKTTRRSHPFPSGMTCARLTADRGEAVLTWCLAAFPVRTSALPEREQASPELSPVCGPKWHGLSVRWDRASCSWKTVLYSLGGVCMSFSGTWPRWGTMLNGECWEQPTPAPHIAATASGLSACWPTPTVCGNYNRKGASKNSGDGLATAVKRRMWPTPTVNDSRNNNPPSQANRNTPPLNVAVGGNLSPMWVEWLMGWPIGWTDLQPLETAKFQQWCDAHGVAYADEIDDPTDEEGYW